MNEFEWRRQMRDLRQPRMPARDLWPAIDAALDDTAIAREAASTARAPSSTRRHWLLGAGLAASLLLACGVGWHMLQTPAGKVDNGVAMSTWKPADPRLAGAAIELDAARMELELAMQQAPDSAALQRLLHRTQQQQTKLRHLTDRAS
jgi:hypothetical protein